MSTTTTNLELIKPDMEDRALIEDINGNMDVIDRAIGDINTAIDELEPAVEKLTPQRKAAVIPADIDDLFSGSVMGLIDETITGSTGKYGVIRAYQVASSVSMQIAEYADGTRATRLYQSSAWGNWV